MTHRIKHLPLVYSCSGSSAAQMANYMALQLDRREIAKKLAKNLTECTNAPAQRAESSSLVS